MRVLGAKTDAGGVVGILFDVEEGVEGNYDGEGSHDGTETSAEGVGGASELLHLLDGSGAPWTA